MSEKKCFACGFFGDERDFFTHDPSFEMSLVFRKPRNKGSYGVGSCDVYACPQCGTLSTDARGEIPPKPETIETTSRIVKELQ